MLIFVGDTTRQADRLYCAIETAGPGTLSHPQYMRRSIDGQVRSAVQKGASALKVSFQFEESGELSFPVA